MRLPDAHRSRAILIGTSVYRSAELTPLAAVRNNLEGLRRVLTDPALGGFTRDRCVIVPDPTSSSAVYVPLKAAANDAEDTLLVYYAGHGLVGSQRHELYLTLTTTDPDSMPVTALRFEVVRDLLKNSRARNRILILDCCFSGRAAEEFPLMSADGVLGQIDVTGTYTLTSSPANMPSIALPGAEYTTFTGELLTLIGKGVPQGPELLTLTKIYQELRSTMISQGFPLPSQSGTDTVTSLALTRNPAFGETDETGGGHEGRAPLPKWPRPRRRAVIRRPGRRTVLGGAACAALVAGAIVLFNVYDPAAQQAQPLAATTVQRHLKCTPGSVCLWPDQNYEGQMWKWTPKKDKDGSLPTYLRNHVGSFDSQVEAGVCFVDTDTSPEQRLPASVKDWGWNYSDRFGGKMDKIQAWCAELAQRAEATPSSTGAANRPTGTSSDPQG
jgi:uncharacterized metal-binding protein